MPDNVITPDTHAHGESPHATIELTYNDIQSKDWEFLRSWASNLDVSTEVLLKRILIAGVIGQLYVEKIPEI